MSWPRAYLSACASVVGYVVAYVACDFFRWPRVFYFPTERAWRITSSVSTAEPMGYVGLVLWGLLGATLAGGGLYAVVRRRQEPVPERWLHLAGAWALTAVALGASYFLWNIWPF